MAGSKEIAIHYIDSADGKEISGKNGEGKFDKGEWINLSTKDFQVSIDGYTYSRTVISSSKQSALAQEKTNIKYIRVSRANKSWKVDYRLDDSGGGQTWNSHQDPIIYIIYDKNTTVDPDPGTPEEPELEPLGTPDHNKYIDYHENTDDYTLTLDVEGKVGEALPIDILLIVDSSRSMYSEEYDWWNNPIPNNRWAYVNNAISTLKNTLLEAKRTNDDLKNVEINLGVTTFSAAGDGTDTVRNNSDAYSQSDNAEDAWIKQNWVPLESFDWTLKESDCTGGTNWQAGVRKGEDLLSQKANSEDYSSRKYVIFLTDGTPTYRYVDGSNTQTQGTGNSDPSNKNYNAAANEWRDSSTLKSSNGRWVVDATTGDSRAENCVSFAENVMGGQYIKGNDNTTMKTAFEKIAQEITKPVYKNVSITDTLSQYVELTDNPDFAVTAVDTENNNTQINLNRNDYTITVYDKDDKEIYSGSDPNTAKDVDWSRGRKVVLTLDLPNTQDSTQSGVLGDNIKYSINFNVKATDFAKQEYVSAGYTDTGDLGTDAEGNHTSSGKEGFYSNDNENTFLTYQENNNAPAYPTYDKPVVQVKATKVQVSKSWVEEEEQTHSSVYVGLYKDGVAVQEDDIREGFTPYIELLGTNNNWTGTFEWLPNLSDGEYTVKELQPVTDDSQKPEFNIDGKGYIGIDSNGIYTEGDKNYEVTYSQDNENVGTSANPVVDFTITNTLEDSVQIVAKKDWNVPESVQETITHASIQVGLYEATTQDDKTNYELVKNDDGTDAVITLKDSNWEANFDNVSIQESDISNYQIFEVVENNGSYERVGNGEYLIIQDTINNEPVDNIYQSNGGSGLVKGDGVYEGTVENTLQLGSIEIAKTDTEGNLLPGAKFEVKNANNEIVATLTTGDEQGGKKGIATLSNLLPGEYTITEIQSPKGYSLLANPVTVVVGTTKGDSTTGNYYEVVNDDDRHYFDLKLKVINNKLFTMPEAGGRNIFMLTLAGTAMIALAAGSTIYYRRRRGVHNKTRR